MLSWVWNILPVLGFRIFGVFTAGCCRSVTTDSHKLLEKLKRKGERKGSKVRDDTDLDWLLVNGFDALVEAEVMRETGGGGGSSLVSMPALLPHAWAVTFLQSFAARTVHRAARIIHLLYLLCSRGSVIILLINWQCHGERNMV